MMEKDPLKISGMHNGANPTIYKNARKLRDNMTKAEQQLWDYLKSKPFGFKFRRQHPIGNFILDFYCHKLRISIEVDGGYHLTTEQKTKDAERTKYVASLGITEYRFTNEEIIVNLNKTIEVINENLRAGSPLGDGGERRNKLDKP
jgi:very-short-patch-repair endonuclease